jgi:hypothetical protein
MAVDHVAVIESEGARVLAAYGSNPKGGCAGRIGGPCVRWLAMSRVRITLSH